MCSELGFLKCLEPWTEAAVSSCREESDMAEAEVWRARLVSSATITTELQEPRSNSHCQITGMLLRVPAQHTLLPLLTWLFCFS